MKFLHPIYDPWPGAFAFKAGQQINQGESAKPKRKGKRPPKEKPAKIPALAKMLIEKGIVTFPLSNGAGK